MDSNCSNSEGGDGTKSSDSKVSRKRKSAANQEMESPPEKRRLIEEEEYQNKTIFDLPIELLTKIINMVDIGQWPSLESISRQFRDVMNISWNQIRELRLDEFRMRKSGYYDGYTRFLGMALCKFVLRAPNITSISGFDTKSCSSLRRSSLASLVQFEHLEKIAFGSNKFFWRNLEFFFESAACQKRLKVLDMSGVSTHSPELDQGINIRLTRLDTFIGSIDGFNIAKRFFDDALLKTLILKGSNWPYHIIPIINRCPNLEKLEFGANWKQQHLAVPLFESVGRLTNLTILKIDDAERVDDRNGIKNLIRTLGQGRRISSIALTCNDEIIGEIAQNLSFLKSVDLDVRACTSASLLVLVTRLKQLESLHLRAGLVESNVNSQVMQAIVANLPGLKSLHIENPKCKSTDFDGLVALPLKELHIKGAKLENSTIKLWNESGLGSRLESLELTKWQGGLKRTVLAKLIKKSPRLRHLHLSKVTNKLATVIINSCPFLTELALMESENISLESIQSIIDNCGNLKIFRPTVSSLKDWNRLEVTPCKYRRVKTYDQFGRLMESDDVDE